MNVAGLRSFSAPTSLAGIRPVDIWKSTAAAPAPIRLGAWLVPWASRPWQLEQLWSNKVLPAVTSCCDAAGADACATPPPRVSDPYSSATTTSPSSSAA